MDRFIFWQRWLLVVSVLVVVFGLGMALLNRTAIFAPVNQGVDPLFWPGGAVTEQVSRFQGWIYGVLGATMAGWGVFMGFIVYYPFRRREVWAWYCLVCGLLLWFVVDTAISAAAGVTFNVVFNTAGLIVLGLPLAFTHQMRLDRQNSEAID